MNENINDLNKELNELREKYSALQKETSKLKKDNEELQMKLMFLDGVANSANDGVLVVNPYGQKILQNQRTVDLWKIPKEVVDDPSGLKQVEHVKSMAIDAQKFVAEIDYLRDHPNETSQDEIELVDGTVLDRYSSPVIGPNGVNYGRIWTFHDITERKNFEKQLIQLNADKDRFISILAHDLRNPFQTLLSFTELLNKELRNYPIEKTEDIVETLYNIIKKTYDLLEDTLLWANIQSKKITYNPAISNVSEIISEVIEILEPSALTKNIKIEFSSKEDVYVNIDVYMLKAILRNLISNAIKFTNNNGKINISMMQSSSHLTIKVLDNGVGIEPDALEKLFSFSPSQSSRGTANETGTGLGLLLCKEFVEKHKGKIWVDSEIGKGTVVSFTIPNLNGAGALGGQKNIFKNAV